MHFWTLAMEPYYSLWMSPDLKTLYGDYLPRDAKPFMAANDVQGVVLVSAASSIHETGYLMGLADSRELVRGVRRRRVRRTGSRTRRRPARLGAVVAAQAFGPISKTCQKMTGF